MYRKLLPLLNRFVMIRQGILGQAYLGRLTAVEQDTVDIQTYHRDGAPASNWTVSMASITEVLTESRQLDNLALSVKWANSSDAALPHDESEPLSAVAGPKTD